MPPVLPTWQFRLKRAFAAEPSVSKTTLNGVLCDERTCRVSAAILEHPTPCLGFALQEAAHVKHLEESLIRARASCRSVVGVAQESGCGRPCGRFFNTDRWSGNFGWPPRAARQPAQPPNGHCWPENCLWY